MQDAVRGKRSAKHCIRRRPPIWPHNAQSKAIVLKAKALGTTLTSKYITVLLIIIRIHE